MKPIFLISQNAPKAITISPMVMLFLWRDLLTGCLSEFSILFNFLKFDFFFLNPDTRFRTSYLHEAKLVWNLAREKWKSANGG